jgi:hypothetical protein
MKISKQLILVSLSIALLFAFSLVTGCVSSGGGAAKTTEITDDTVRVPPGDPTTFWDEMGWVDLTKAEQALWGVLGWNGDSWEGEAKKPPSEDKYWKQLNDAERAACEKLSYTKRTWDM